MNKRITLIATGDSFMTRSLPEMGYDGFNEISAVIKSYEARFCNLEITVHNGEGYPAAFSGGTWAMTEPSTLDELQKYGFNIYNTANNHSFDYSYGGLLATIDNLKQRNLRFAGTGSNLAAASAATYLETTHARIGLVAACSSFHESGAAGNQRFDAAGRPGLNPLRYKTVYHVEKPYYDVLQMVAKITNMNAEKQRSINNGYAPPLPEGKMSFGGLSFQLDDVNETRTEPLQKDMDRIIKNIQEAKRQADYAFVSIHSHEFSGNDITKPAEFLRTFCHACIDAGADAVIGHGPHELRGIEMYKGKAIFYSLGNFIFQTETVKVQPADAYENHSMSNTDMVGTYMDHRSKNGTVGYGVQPNIWRSVMAGMVMEDGAITQIKLYPIVLDMDYSRGQKGCPHISRDTDVLKYLAQLSAPYGTRLNIEGDAAVVVL